MGRGPLWCARQGPVRRLARARSHRPLADYGGRAPRRIASLRDRDFSVSITRTSDDELGELVEAYNSLGGLLRRERVDLYQRELLLDTVIQTTPLALISRTPRAA